MDHPAADQIREVIRSITEPFSSKVLQANVDKYFAPDSRIIHPMLNSPIEAGREGVKAAYKMLRVLTINNKIVFHTVAFDRITEIKGVEYQTGLIDLTENLQLRFLPVPTSLNPVIPLRILVRIDLRKAEDGRWYIIRQEDNLPSDFGSTGIRFFPGPISLADVTNGIKWAIGMGTWMTGSILTKLDLF